MNQLINELYAISKLLFDLTEDEYEYVMERYERQNRRANKLAIRGA